jgi:membrane protein YdbS with pleckstrin-like domain
MPDSEAQQSATVPEPTLARFVADGREHRLDPRSIRAARLAGIIFAAVVAGGLFVGVVVSVIAAPPTVLGGLARFAGWFFFAAALTGLQLWWPAVSYRHTSYEITDLGMRIRRGVVWRSVSSVPRSRVQHTDVSQGPIERAFGLATLVVYTAGTHHASVSLGGLAHETALHIRDHLIVGAEDDAV